MQDLQAAIMHHQPVPNPYTYAVQSPAPFPLRSEDVYLTCLLRNRQIDANKINLDTVKAELKVINQIKSRLIQLATTPNAKAFKKYVRYVPWKRQLELMQKYLAQPPQDQLTPQELEELEELSDGIGHTPVNSQRYKRYEELQKKFPK